MINSCYLKCQEEDVGFHYFAVCGYRFQSKDQRWYFGPDSLNFDFFLPEKDDDKAASEVRKILKRQGLHGKIVVFFDEPSVKVDEGNGLPWSRFERFF